MIEQINTIKSCINQAAIACGRNPETIKLVAVSKTKSADMVSKAIKAGITIFGENYIQEAADKIKTLSYPNVSWHFIGHLQTNKAKPAVRLFDLIHTVDSLKLALELNKHAGKMNKVQNILIQVNIGNESSKSGIYSEKTLELVKNLSRLEYVSVKGLMTIPPFFENPEDTRPFFSALRKLKDLIIKETMPHVIINDLSMGMSNDYKVAIQEGATFVRIGTAIFGKRH